MRRAWWRLWPTGLLAGLLCACVNLPGVAERTALADRLAGAKAWHRQWLDAGAFRLASYLPLSVVAADTLTVYIEGDGLAWLSPNQASDNPTPLDPMGLRLALAQARDGGDKGDAAGATAVAYLGRPCQYTDAHSDPHPEAQTGPCAPRYWTEQRFAPEVIASIGLALDHLKRSFQARQLRLVGYSGGAAVAALVAARRGDVVWLVSVAGNLDTAEWTRYHHLRPLSGSLNPADATEALQGIAQMHFVGGKDLNIPPALVQGFVRRFSDPAKVRWHVEPGFDHHCCWEHNWAERLAQAVGPSQVAQDRTVSGDSR